MFNVLSVLGKRMLNQPFNQLDIYYPPSSHLHATPKILFWVYGGGFVTGDRQLGPPPMNLAYKNLGAYFARKGFVTVIPDYRLVPNVTFPGMSEDIRDALQWTMDHPSDVGVDNVDDFLVMAHSAGATNVLTMFLVPHLLPEDLKKRCKGLILVSGTYQVANRLPLPVQNILAQYYGTAEAAVVNSGCQLVTDAASLNGFPPTLIVESEREPSAVADSGRVLRKLMEKRLAREVPYFMAKGHNHISLNWALNSGQGEEWAEEVIGWIWKQ